MVCIGCMILSENTLEYVWVRFYHIHHYGVYISINMVSLYTPRLRIKEVILRHRQQGGVHRWHDFVIDITMMNIGCTDLSYTTQ